MARYLAYFTIMKGRVDAKVNSGIVSMVDTKDQNVGTNKRGSLAVLDDDRKEGIPMSGKTGKIVRQATSSVHSESAAESRDIARIADILANAFRKCVVEPLLPFLLKDGARSARESGGAWRVAERTPALKRQLREATAQWLAEGGTSEAFDPANGPIAEAIRKAAREQRKTQKAIADELGISPAVISRVLKHPNKARIETLRRIGTTVGVGVLVAPALLGSQIRPK